MNMPSESLSGWIVQQVIHRRLVAPTIALVYAHKPLGFIGAQMLLLLQPLLDIVFPRRWIEEGIALLADREGLDALVRRLEAYQARPSAASGPYRRRI